ncbi:uncharacterized protein LOC143424857 [Xylocopa sonorina]|uniref:uncharacterized protein LOC143424857 n=1 Tax=Xylocopa sonorina TaxID=1818115 RepID=UPI00403AA58A
MRGTETNEQIEAREKRRGRHVESRGVRGKRGEQKLAKALPSVGRPFYYTRTTLRVPVFRVKASSFVLPALSLARSVGRECARALTRAHPKRERERERERERHSGEKSCRDRRAYTAIERGDSYEGGRVIELNRGRFSRGKKTTIVRHCPCRLLVITVTIVVDETVNETLSTLQRKVFLLGTKIYERIHGNSRYGES